MIKRRIISFLWLMLAVAAAVGLVWRVDWNCQYLASDGRVVQWRKTFKQISASVALAKQEHKRVLLEFGLPHECTYCALLSKVFENDAQIAEVLREDYVVVKVDAKGQDNPVCREYGDPTCSLPFTAILDSDGRQLVGQNIAFLNEEAIRQRSSQNIIDRNQVLAFLKRWAVGDGNVGTHDGFEGWKRDEQHHRFQLSP